MTVHQLRPSDCYLNSQWWNWQCCDRVKTDGKLFECFQIIDKNNYDKIEKLFITVYFIASNVKPLGDFTIKLDLFVFINYSEYEHVIY